MRSSLCNSTQALDLIPQSIQQTIVPYDDIRTNTHTHNVTPCIGRKIWFFSVNAIFQSIQWGIHRLYCSRNDGWPTTTPDKPATRSTEWETRMHYPIVRAASSQQATKKLLVEQNSSWQFTYYLRLVTSMVTLRSQNMQRMRFRDQRLILRRINAFCMYAILKTQFSA